MERENKETKIINKKLKQDQNYNLTDHLKIYF